MKYIDWFVKHSKKHRAILEGLKSKSKEEIIGYFDYDNMRQKEPNFCILYATDTKCHDIKNLNCYMCGCPYFRFNDNGIETREHKIVYSMCAKGLGELFESKNVIHQDCTQCTLPHTKKFINDNFDLNWSMIMRDVNNI